VTFGRTHGDLNAVPMSGESEIFMTKRTLFVLGSVALLCETIVARPVPDQIGKAGRDRVRFDFRRPDPLVIDDDATINDASDIAAAVLEQYVIPHVDSGEVSARDFALLNFCYFAQVNHAEKCRRAIQSEMGGASYVLGGLAEARPFIFTDGPDGVSAVESVQERLGQLPYKMDAKAQSFCRKYNAREGGPFLFADDGKIAGALYDARANEEKQYRIALDTECYGEYPQLRWAMEGFMGRPFAVCVGGVGGCLALAAAVGWIPGPGWFIVGGALLVAGATGWYYYNYNKAQECWLTAVKLKNENVKAYVRRVGERESYLQDVIENSDGTYQRTYMNLVDVAMLLERWRQSGWRGCGGLTDRQRNDLNEVADKAQVRARDALVALEDSCINYPLFVDLIEASSTCLYLHYLDQRANRDGSRAEASDIQRYYLGNARKISDVCSRLAEYSTGKMPLAYLEAYNVYFAMTYATNRVEVLGKDKKAVKAFWEKASPLFDTADQASVDEGYVRIGNASEYAEQYAAYQAIYACPLLSDIVRVEVGDDKALQEWKEGVEKRIHDYWLYPSWSEEAKRWRAPECVGKIIDMVKVFANTNNAAERAALMLDAAIKSDERLKGLETFRKPIVSADSREDAKSSFVSNLSRRKMPETLKQEIVRRYGSAEAMVDAWFVIALAEGPEATKKDGAVRLDDVVKALQVEVLPLWKQIDALPWRFWRWWF